MQIQILVGLSIFRIRLSILLTCFFNQNRLITVLIAISTILEIPCAIFLLNLTDLRLITANLPLFFCLFLSTLDRILLVLWLAGLILIVFDFFHDFRNILAYYLLIIIFLRYFLTDLWLILINFSRRREQWLDYLELIAELLVGLVLQSRVFLDLWEKYFGLKVYLGLEWLINRRVLHTSFRTHSSNTTSSRRRRRIPLFHCQVALLTVLRGLHRLPLVVFLVDFANVAVALVLFQEDGRALAHPRGLLRWQARLDIDVRSQIPNVIGPVEDNFAVRVEGIGFQDVHVIYRLQLRTLSFLVLFVLDNGILFQLIMSHTFQIELVFYFIRPPMKQPLLPHERQIRWPHAVIVVAGERAIGGLQRNRLPIGSQEIDFIPNQDQSLPLLDSLEVPSAALAAAQRAARDR